MPLSPTLTSGFASPQQGRGRRCLSGSPRRRRPSFSSNSARRPNSSARCAGSTGSWTNGKPSTAPSRTRKWPRRPGRWACPGRPSRRRGRLSGLVLDAGALIALDREDQRMLRRLLRARQDGDPVRTNPMALAQAWRDGRRQADARQGAPRRRRAVDDGGGRTAGPASCSLRREPATRSTPAWRCSPSGPTSSTPATPATCGSCAGAAGIQGRGDRLLTWSCQRSSRCGNRRGRTWTPVRPRRRPEVSYGVGLSALRRLRAAGGNRVMVVRC